MAMRSLLSRNLTGATRCYSDGKGRVLNYHWRNDEKEEEAEKKKVEEELKNEKAEKKKEDANKKSEGPHLQWPPKIFKRTS